MQLTIRSGNPAAEACDALVVPVAADKRLSGPAAAEHGRLAGGAAVQGLSGMTIGSLVVVLPERADARFVQGLAEGLALASYRFDRYRTPQEPETAVRRGAALHRAGARRRGSDRRSAGPGGQGSHLRRLTLRRSVADLDGWQRAAKIGFRSPGELGREAIATRADATLRERAP